jgi:hypothetical protein
VSLVFSHVKGTVVSPASLLFVTNENPPGNAEGRINAYQQLVDTGELAALGVVSHKALGTSAVDDQTFRAVLDRVRASNYDLVVIGTPKAFPSTLTQFSQLEEAIGGRPLLYWEGDPWGKGKPITKQMRWWFGRSDIVFSIGGSSQADMYVEAGAKRVCHTPHTYCHLEFADAEANVPAPISDREVVVIGSNLARIPYLTGLPGSVGRRQLTKRLRKDPSLTLRLFGPGWPKGWSSGRIAFARQTDELRKGRVSANWDHYPQMPDYGSDRLAISLIAGRPHVTTRHPGGEWLPGEELGLFQESSPRLVHDRVRNLLDTDPAVTYKMGVAAHAWAAHRMSHREGARYILSQVLDEVAQPPGDPWANLPGPWEPPRQP